MRIVFESSAENEKIADCLAGRQSFETPSPFSQIMMLLGAIDIVGSELYSPYLANYGKQASVRKVAIPNVLKVLLMFLLQSVGIRNRSPNPELELPRNNLLKRLFGWNIA